jgi:hypothetical protein
MQRNNHNSKLWATEFGWGTYDGILTDGADAPAPASAQQFGLINDEQQAQYTLRAIELMQSPPLSDWVEVAFLWNLNYAVGRLPVENGQEQAGYSLLNVDGYPRLLYRYIQTARIVE